MLNLKRPLVGFNIHLGVKFYNLKKTYNIKHKIYDINLFFRFRISYPKDPLYIPKYRRLFIGRVFQLNTMEPAMEISHILAFIRSLYSFISD